MGRGGGLAGEEEEESIDLRSKPYPVRAGWSSKGTLLAGGYS